MDTFPSHLLSLDDWTALPENSSRHVELLDGVLLVALRPAPRHQLAVANLAVALNRQLPPTLAALPEVEIVIQAEFPPTVRAPDVAITSANRYRENPPRFDAGDVLVAVEVLSPGSRRIDRIVKPGEYAELGIPHYWTIDLEEPATLTAHTLVDGAYEPVVESTGIVKLVEPATVTIDVSRLAELRFDRSRQWERRHRIAP